MIDEVQDTYIAVLESANRVLEKEELSEKSLKDDDLPKLEIDKFGGDPLDYQYFKCVFQDSIEAKCKDPGKCLRRLMQYTKGPAKKLYLIVPLLEKVNVLRRQKLFLVKDLVNHSWWLKLL